MTINNSTVDVYFYKGNGDVTSMGVNTKVYATRKFE